MNQMTVVHREHAVSDLERMAHAFASSRLFGVQNPEQALALCLIAQAEGRHPASAAQDYHIINGRPSKKADAMLRDFISGGGKIEWHSLDDTKADATFSHPAGGTVRIDWDLARAKKAGIKNAMWDKYPRSMLRARVVSEGVRTVYPMATSGMYVPEEVQEFEPAREQAHVTLDGEVIEAKPLPKAKSRDAYAEFSAEIAKCETLEELAALWSSSVAKKTLASLPDDWRQTIIEEKDARKAELAPFDAEGFLANLYAELEDAASPELVEQVWDAFGPEAALNEHEAQLQDAFDMKKSRLEALS